MRCCFLRICTDVHFCYAVVGAGDYGEFFRDFGIYLPCDADIAQKNILQLSQPVGIGHGLSQFVSDEFYGALVGRQDFSDGLIKQGHEFPPSVLVLG